MSIKFPDDYVIFGRGWQKEYDFNKEAASFKKILDDSKTENDIQSYIKSNQKWFIPASIFEDYDFGHHEAYLRPECQLGNDYRTDYMLIGRNSLGYHIVLVEFENANVDFKLKNQSSESETVRKGLAQIRDWKRWIDREMDHFLRSMDLTSIMSNIPTYGFEYCLVVGRRQRMDETANQLRMQMEHESSNLKIISYDRLADNVKRLSNGF